MSAEGGIDRYERMLALHHGLRLNRRLGALLADEVPRTPVAYPAALHEQDQRLLAESVELVAHAAPELVRRFYEQLFAWRPFLRRLFPDHLEVMAAQRDKLLKALLALVAGYAHPERLAPLLQQLGRDHRKFGVRPVHYTAVGEALVTSLRELAGPAWRVEYEQAWVRAYTLAADLMIAAAEAADTEPPFWYATVVEHDLRHPEIAVLWLRPNQPFDYRAGQFTTVESRHLPRMWRPYSMATAPRPDCLLQLHVRAVPGGTVSAALVHKTGAGDVLRLGPPIGTSVINPASRRDLLLAAGGTGLAPLKAMIDELANHPRQRSGRRVTLLVGARRPAELYDLADLRQMAAGYPWLSLWLAVSDDPTFSGLHGTVPDLLGQYGYRAGWRHHDIHLAGQPGMIRASLHQLAAIGVPEEQIRWDAHGELAAAVDPG